MSCPSYPLTVSAIRNALRKDGLPTDWIEVGMRPGGDADSEYTWNAIDWPSDEHGWIHDDVSFEPLRNVLKALRKGGPRPVELDLYCYKTDGVRQYKETVLLGNVEMTIDADGVVTLDGEAVLWR